MTNSIRVIFEVSDAGTYTEVKPIGIDQVIDGILTYFDGTSCKFEKPVTVNFKSDHVNRRNCSLTYHDFRVIPTIKGENYEHWILASGKSAREFPGDPYDSDLLLWPVSELRGIKSGEGWDFLARAMYDKLRERDDLSESIFYVSENDDRLLLPTEPGTGKDTGSTRLSYDSGSLAGRVAKIIGEWILHEKKELVAEDPSYSYSPMHCLDVRAYVQSPAKYYPDASLRIVGYIERALLKTGHCFAQEPSKEAP